jgi:hypothetical protein
MKVRRVGENLIVTSDNETQIKTSLTEYRKSGYSLDYFCDELMRTQNGPTRTFTAILVKAMPPNVIPFVKA